MKTRMWHEDQGSWVIPCGYCFAVGHGSRKHFIRSYLPLCPLPPAPKRGFTLIELMIVVIIIAALSAMVVPRLSNRSEQAKIAVADADINSNIGLALKLYKLDNGRYPTTAQGVKALLSQPTSSPAPQNWNGPYLETDPVDPWKEEYKYKSPGEHNTSGYDLYSVGPDGVEGNEDDIKNWE